MEENSPNTIGANRQPDGTFGPGNIANPNGRPKGSISIKDRVRQWLEEHPDDMTSFVEHFVKKNKELAWQMLEGRPAQGIEHSGEITEKQFIITRGEDKMQNLSEGSVEVSIPNKEG